MCYSSEGINDRKVKQPADMKRVLMVWIKINSHYIPLSLSPVQSKALILFWSLEAERVRRPQKRRSEASKLVHEFKKDSLRTIKEQGEVASAHIEAAANYPEDLAKDI